MTIDSAFEQLWRAIDPDIPFNPEAAIVQEWRANYREWGSPVKPEQPLEDGGVFQVFSHQIVKWTPESGVELVDG